MGLLSIEIYKSMIGCGRVFNYLKAVVRARFEIIRSWSRFYYKVNWVCIRFNSLSNLLIFNLGVPRALQTNYYCSLLLSILDKSIGQADNLLSFQQMLSMQFIDAQIFIIMETLYIYIYIYIYMYELFKITKLLINFNCFDNFIYIYIYIFSLEIPKSFMNQLDHIPLFRNSVVLSTYYLILDKYMLN